jgi:hypothetical protein
MPELISKALGRSGGARGRVHAYVFHKRKQSLALQTATKGPMRSTQSDKKHRYLAARPLPWREWEIPADAGEIRFSNRVLR